MNNAHIDTPKMDEPTRQLYGMVRGRAPVWEIFDHLSGAFNLEARLQSVPTYKQANGFWTFKLGSEDGRMVRLHYWPSGLREATETAGIHDHVFDFTSLVLTGSEPMINMKFIMQQDPESDLAIYEVDYKTPQLQAIRKLADHFRPVAVRTDRVPPGNYYDFPAGEFHTSNILGNSEAVTLMATQDNPAIRNPRFIGPGNLAVQPEYQRLPLTAGERAFVAARLRASL